MATVERHDVALSVARWAQAVRKNNEIRDEVKKPGRLNELAVSDCAFDNSGSSITHTEYLHLRTVWYRYDSDKHIEDFAKLLRDNHKTGYKGFITPSNDERARRLVAHMSPYLKRYIQECRRSDDDPASLHPSPDCGYFAMVRCWQVLATTHTKGDGPARSKILKPQAREETRGRPTTPAAQHAPGGPSTVATPPRQVLSSSLSPPKFETPAATSHPAARGTAENRPSADEAYVNVALLLLLQAVTQEFHGSLSELHWVPPRMALHLCAPVWNRINQTFEKKPLLEAQVDGYLCYGKDQAGLGRPLAICEAKSAVRRSIQVSTERKEAAEMAAWICHCPLDEGLLQRSASGKKRRLMISQNRHEVYIIIGEYGPRYEQYIRSAPWKAGDKAAKPTPLARDFVETLGSPTFMRQLVEENIKDIDGWKDPAVSEALRKLPPTLPASTSRHGPQTPHGGPSGSAASPAPAISGQLPVRPKTDRAPLSDRAPHGGGRVTRSAAAALDLPSVGGFLVMHRFGPWNTDDHSNMEVFVRRLLALMLELHDNKPQSRPSSRGSSDSSSRSSSAAGDRGRASSATGNQAPLTTGIHAPSAVGHRAPSATGKHASMRPPNRGRPS